MSVESPTTTSNVRVLIAAVVASSAGVMPAFLVGALAAEMRSDLGFSASGLGIAVSGYFLSAGLIAVLFGRRVARWGWRRSMRTAAAGTLCTVILIATSVRSWRGLLVVMAFGGMWHALVVPASNLAVARGVWQDRQGLSFGIRQAAIPATMMFAGLSVPVIALTVGWRWAFVAAAAFPVAAIVLVPRGPRSGTPSEPSHRPGSDNQHMWILSVAGGAASASVGAMSAFVVLTSVDAGMDTGTAGQLLALASMVGLVVRATAGWLADRYRLNGFRVVIWLLLVGTAGYLAIATGDVAAVALGTIIGFVGGWGWSGLFHFGVVRSNPGNPASATGVAQTGLSFGAALGPLAFGFVVESSSFAVAWLGIAVVSVIAAGLVGLYLRRSSSVKIH